MPQWLTVSDLVKVVVLLIPLTITGMAGWFALENRVTLAEHAMEQETKGYSVVQGDFSRRLEKLDERITKRLDRIEAAIDRIHRQ